MVSLFREEYVLGLAFAGAVAGAIALGQPQQPAPSPRMAETRMAATRTLDEMPYYNVTYTFKRPPTYCLDEKVEISNLNECLQFELAMPDMDIRLVPPAMAIAAREE